MAALISLKREGERGYLCVKNGQGRGEERRGGDEGGGVGGRGVCCRSRAGFFKKRLGEEEMKSKREGGGHQPQMHGGQVQMLLKQKGLLWGEAWHSPLCVSLHCRVLPGSLMLMTAIHSGNG